MRCGIEVGRRMSMMTLGSTFGNDAGALYTCVFRARKGSCYTHDMTGDCHVQGWQDALIL